MTDAKPAWGGGVKVACPHCGDVRAKNHQRVCEKNPNRDLALVEKLRAGGQKRAAQAVPVIAPVVTSDLTPTGDVVQIPPDVKAAMDADRQAARQSQVPIRPVQSQGPDADKFMRARIDELRSTKAPPVVPPAGAQVTAKPKGLSLPTGLVVKLAIGTACAAVLAFLVSAWRKRPAKAQTPPAAMKETYKGPRAWTPDPSLMPVSPDDVRPWRDGGGFVPSPETEWDNRNAASLRRHP